MADGVFFDFDIAGIRKARVSRCSEHVCLAQQVILLRLPLDVTSVRGDKTSLMALSEPAL